MILANSFLSLRVKRDNPHACPITEITTSLALLVMTSPLSLRVLPLKDVAISVAVSRSLLFVANKQ
jgi:hypothetical protein